MWGNFYGNLFEHCTSAPMWLNASKSQATIVCPLDGLFTLAWGKKEKVKLPKDWSNNRLKDEEKRETRKEIDV